MIHKILPLFYLCEEKAYLNLITFILPLIIFRARNTMADITIYKIAMLIPISGSCLAAYFLFVSFCFYIFFVSCLWRMRQRNIWSYFLFLWKQHALIDVLGETQFLNNNQTTVSKIDGEKSVSEFSYHKLFYYLTLVSIKWCTYAREMNEMKSNEKVLNIFIQFRWSEKGLQTVLIYSYVQ